MPLKRTHSSLSHQRRSPINSSAMGAKPSTPATCKRKRNTTQQSTPSYADFKPGLPTPPHTGSLNTSQLHSVQGRDHAATQGKVPQFDEHQCEQWFQSYADPDNPSLISPEGMERFFGDLGLSVQDIATIALASKMQLTTMGNFGRSVTGAAVSQHMDTWLGHITKEEWMHSMRAWGIDSLDGLLQKRDIYERVLHDPTEFKDMYRYVFGYVKNKNQKCMDVETAMALWPMLLIDQFPGKRPLVEAFIVFLQDKEPVRMVNKDQWQSFYEFITSISDDLSNYDETSAWPVLLDEFVEWKKQQQ